MEENAADHLTAYISGIPASEEASLHTIRHWKNLSVAFDGDMVWIKGFTQEQALAPFVKQIPFMELYEQKLGLLFKKGKLVPERKMPKGLLWNPVNRAFPVSLDEVNHNFFGIQQNIPVRIVPAAAEQVATALLSDMEVAEKYITTAAAVRLNALNWCLLGKQAFFTGTPLLSIPGTAYWSRSAHYIPAGFDFEFPMLEKNIRKQLDPEGENKIIWFRNNSYALLPAKYLVPLSVSSFRLSKQ